MADPKAPTWSLITAIPIEEYRRVFVKSWWDTVYRQQGIKALKFVPFLWSGRPAKTVLQVGGDHQDAEIIKAFRNRHTVRWMLSTASETLRDTGNFILERFLRLATFEVASAKILRRRLHYERYGWDSKFSQIFNILAGAAHWYNYAERYVDFTTNVTAFAFSPLNVDVELDYGTNVFKDTLAMLREAIRILNQECAYLDNIIQYVHFITTTICAAL